MTKEQRAPYDFNRIKSFKPTDKDMKSYHDKETIRTIVFIAPNPRYKKGERHSRKYTTPVKVVLYMGRSSNAMTVYCSLWANSRDNNIFIGGNGTASGGGYDKESAAINDAFYSCGVVMDQPFDGCGEEPTDHAIRALAKRLGWHTGDIMRF